MDGQHPHSGELKRGLKNRHIQLIALGGAIGLAYVPCAGKTEADVLASRYEIEVAGTRFPAEVSLAPMYDPGMARIKS